MQYIYFRQSKLPSNFWDATLGLTNDKKVFLAYLYTSPFSNRLGCFYYPIDNIVRDLDYDPSDVIDDLYALEKNAFVSGDAAREWIYLPTILGTFLYEILIKGNILKSFFIIFLVDVLFMQI